MRARLVVVAHGSRDAEGPRAIVALSRMVRRRLPDADVTTAYVELVDPPLTTVMRSSEGPTVVVPLLLSTGHHMTTDLPAAARGSSYPVALARPLGPDPLLAAVMGMRLRAAGARRGDAVVMVAAGSRDPDAVVDTENMRRMLQAHWGAPVRVAHLTGHGTRPAHRVEELRAAGRSRIAVVPYLLAPGHFATRARTHGLAAGASAVADVLGAHPLVAELVVRRYLALESRLPQLPPASHLRPTPPRLTA